MWAKLRAGAPGWREIHDKHNRPKLVPLRDSIASLKRMKACPHRTKRADCGCSGLAMCGLGKGRAGLVNHRDCLDCLSADPAASSQIDAIHFIGTDLQSAYEARLADRQ